jgi:tetratricopeptide (TPR) repeat protein
MKKTCFTLIPALLFAINGFCQNLLFCESPQQIDNYPRYNNHPPDSLYTYIHDSLKTPFEATANCIEGLVVVEFTVTKDNRLDSFIIKKNIGGGCDQEALRLIKNTDGKWTAGLANNQPIDVRFSCPILFKTKNPRCEKTIDYYYKKANKYFYAQLYEKALVYFDHVVRSNPYDQDAIYKRGITKFETGDKKGACSDWKMLRTNIADKLIEEHCANEE